MTTDKATFRIHLPTLFAKVNEHRRQDGLPPVEPAIMAVRASIKFTLRRQKYLNLNREALDVNKEDAQHLCEALAELFNVSLTPDQGSGNGAPTAGTASIQEPAATRIAPPAASGADPPAQKVWQLPLVQFYAAINKERRSKGLLPVEPAVISVRTGVKFSILRRRPIDFQATRLPVDGEDLAVLENIIAQQFDVSIPGGLVSLCERGTADHRADEKPATDQGVVSRLLGQFVGGYRRARQYSLDTNHLLLAILKRRTYMGHKPMRPEMVRSRCAQALRVELELETDLRDPMLSLSREQLDAFADIIRREFQIMFDDLDDLMQESARTEQNREKTTGKRDK